MESVGEPVRELEAYYLQERSDVEPFVPTGLGRVLDVGCAAGGFGALLKAKGKAREVWGIELNAEAARRAEGRLDRVLVGDAVERLREMPRGEFDAVCFTDVLEHLAWPDEALREAVRCLAPGGVVVASLPNIRNITALVDIVWQGEFRYREEGIFDRTHLRFFTRSTIPDWFDRGGLAVERLEGINGTFGWRFAVLNALMLGRLEDARWMQFVIVARPK